MVQQAPDVRVSPPTPVEACALLQRALMLYKEVIK